LESARFLEPLVSLLDEFDGFFTLRLADLFAKLTGDGWLEELGIV